jgi:hypothetical protein
MQKTQALYSAMAVSGFILTYWGNKCIEFMLFMLGFIPVVYVSNSMILTKVDWGAWECLISIVVGNIEY